MAYDDDDDLDPDERWDGNVRNLPPGLRAHVRKLEKENRTNTERLASLERESRTRTIQSVLDARGINPKIAAFIPTDVPATEHDVARWVDDYADVFSPATRAQTQPSATPAVDSRTGETSSLPEAQPSNVYDFASMADQQARMEAASQGGVPVEVAGDLMAKIQSATSFEDMEALRGINTQGRFG